MRWCRKRSANSASAACTNANASIAGSPALVAGADAGQEEALQRPRARRVGEVRAGHEHRVVGGRPGGQRARAREGRRRPVLQRGHVPVAVEVDLAPGAELVLDVLDPAPLVDRALPLRLPPDAAAADLGPARLGRSGEVLDRHRGQLRASSGAQRRAQPQQRHLGPREEPQRHERRAEARRDVHDRAVAGLERARSGPSADARGRCGRRARARRSGRRAGGPRARDARCRAPAGAACPGSGRAACAGRRSGRGGWQGRTPGSRIMRSAEAPASEMRRPLTASSIAAPSSSVDAAEVARVPALRERVAAAREIVVAEHRDGAVARRAHELGSRRPRSPAPARRRATRSPVTATMSGSSSLAHSRAAAQQGEARAVARVHVRDVQDREPVEGSSGSRDRDLAHAPAQRQRLRSGGRDRPLPPRQRRALCQRIIGGIVAAGTLQGRPQGRRRALELRNWQPLGCQTRPGAGGPSVAGRPPVGVRSGLGTREVVPALEHERRALRQNVPRRARPSRRSRRGGRSC